MLRIPQQGKRYDAGTMAVHELRCGPMKRLILTFSLLLSCLVLFTAPTGHAAEPETTWMKVLLDGRKIGYARFERHAQPNQVVSSHRMELTIERVGVALTLVTEESSTETPQGAPLAFSNRIRMSGMDNKTTGKIENGKAVVETEVGGIKQQHTVAWPPQALLMEGIKLLEKKQGLKIGTTYQFESFDTSNLESLAVNAAVVANETVVLGQKREKLVRLDQRIHVAGVEITTRTWVTPEHEIKRMTMPLLGLEFEMVACDQACAKAPNQPPDILEKTLVASPRALSAEERQHPLQYQLELAGPESAQLLSTSEQKAVADPSQKTFSVLISSSAVYFGHDSPPVEQDVSANKWLNSGDMAIITAAKEATANATGDLQRMQMLEAYVRSHIGKKSMRIGYASALETFKSQEGDCTEHALLLAALARALKIPAQVVNGLAYAPSFADRANVFVPHAWVRAWIAQGVDKPGWRSFDAALPGFDSGHIALSVGDGDASGFYAGVNLLGNLRIKQVAAMQGKKSQKTKP